MRNAIGAQKDWISHMVDPQPKKAKLEDKENMWVTCNFTTRTFIIYHIVNMRIILEKQTRGENLNSC